MKPSPTIPKKTSTDLKPKSTAESQPEKMDDGKNATVAIGGVGGFNSHWWWALASAGQLTWGISASRRVCNYRLVPYKALGVATLFVSAGASAAVSTLHACGIRTVKDIQELSQKTKGCITVRQSVSDESESL